MTTFLQSTTTPPKFVLGQQALQERVLDYLETRGSRILSTLWAQPGLLFDAVGLTEGTTGTPAVPALSVDAGDYAGVIGDAGDTVEQEPFHFAHDDTGFQSVPFDNTAGGGTVNVYLRAVKYPDLVSGAMDGKYHLTGWKWGIGERAEPDAVAVAGPDLVFTIDTAIGGIPWPTSDAGRTVWVWLKVPDQGSTTSLVIQQGTATSDGVNVKVTLANTTMGQASPSTTASDYEVFVPGLFITDSAAQKTDANYVFIGSITGAAHDTSDVVIHDLEALADLTDVLLRQPARAAIAMQHEAGIDWLEAGAVTTDDNPGGGVDATLTFNDPDTVDTEGIAVRTGGRMGYKWKAGGLVATLPGSSPADTYVVYIDADPAGAASGVNLELKITDATTFSGTLFPDYVAIYRFDWDGAQPAGSRITNEQPANLNYQRGIIHPKLLAFGRANEGHEAMVTELVLYPNQFGTGAPSYGGIFSDVRRAYIMIKAREDASGSPNLPGLTLYAVDDSITTASLGNLNQLERLEFFDHGDGPIWQFFGPAGDHITDDSLGDDERVIFTFGGQDKGLRLTVHRETGDNHETVSIAVDGDDAVIKRLLELRSGEGSAHQQRPSTNPEPWALLAPDFKLLMEEDGSVAGHFTGKIVARGVPLVPFYESGGAGSWSVVNLTPRYVGAAAGNTIDIPIPPPGVTGDGYSGGYTSGPGLTGPPPKLIGVLVDISIAATAGPPDPNAGDGLDVTLRRVNGGASLTNLSSTVTWRFAAQGRAIVEAHTGGGSADSIDGLYVGEVVDEEKSYYVKIAVARDGTPIDTTRIVKSITALWRVYEFGQ